MIILSISLAFVATIISSFTLGFWAGKEDFDILSHIKPKETLKVIKKAEPKTHLEKRTEAMDNDKEILKTFSK